MNKAKLCVSMGSMAVLAVVATIVCTSGLSSFSTPSAEESRIVGVVLRRDPGLLKGSLGSDAKESLEDDPAPVCWKDSYGRGVGTIPDQCPGEDKNGALCYPLCKDGYYGVGPVCWEHCPHGWVDEGALCRKKGSIETKAKHSYGRGAGTLMHCPESLEEQSGLCYTPCRSGYSPVGPVCWAVCTTPDSFDGGALCCSNSSTCTSKILSLSTGLPLAVMQAVIAGDDPSAVIKAVVSAINSVLGYVMPLCSQLDETVDAEKVIQQIVQGNRQGGEVEEGVVVI